MDKLIIKGGESLKGTVSVSSAKNATLPILAATLLTPHKIHLKNIPGLSDVQFFLSILENLGAKIERNENEVFIQADEITSQEASYEFVRKMRASILVLGPLLTRFKKARVSLPGGCAIGTRPVDLHLEGLKKMGAEINIESGYIIAETQGLVGTHIHLDFPSVGATENLMMAACLAEGETVISNAASEPEIEDLGNFLKTLGFTIEGHGSPTITIKGESISTLKENPVYAPIGDRIEAITYIIAGIIQNSEITVNGFNPKHIESVLGSLKEVGANFLVGDDYVTVLKTTLELKPVHIKTGPYPEFPTDAQAQMMALLGFVKGESIIEENIFENRFMHVSELHRLGMDIRLEGHIAYINGVDKLTGAEVMCTDLRASAALILAALRAEGESTVLRIYHLDRGYENIEKKLEKIGANIQRIN